MSWPKQLGFSVVIKKAPLCQRKGEVWLRSAEKNLHILEPLHNCTKLGSNKTRSMKKQFINYFLNCLFKLKKNPTDRDHMQKYISTWTLQKGPLDWLESWKIIRSKISWHCHFTKKYKRNWRRKTLNYCCYLVSLTCVLEVWRKCSCTIVTTDRAAVIAKTNTLVQFPI